MRALAWLLAFHDHVVALIRLYTTAFRLFLTILETLKQIKNRRQAIAPTRNNTVELAKTLLTSNSLAGAACG